MTVLLATTTQIFYAYSCASFDNPLKPLLWIVAIWLYRRFLKRRLNNIIN